jgi:hypothetical protein
MPQPPSQTTITSLTIHAGEHLCADADRTLIVGDYFPTAHIPTVHVLNGGIVNLIAGQNIIILPSTVVDAGGYLHAFITPNCIWCEAYQTNLIVTAQPDTTVNVIPGDTFIDKSANNLFKVYPNPTTGVFTLELTEVTETSVVKVEIYGMYGEKLQSDQFTGEKRHEFTLDGKSNGIYFIRVFCGGNLGSQKIIKQ